MVEADQTEYEFIIDKQKAMLYGIAPQQIVHTLNMALSERPISNLYDEDASTQVGLILALEEKEKSTIQDISQLKIRSKTGTMISVGDLVDVNETIRDKSIYHKNQKRVVYVMVALPEGYSMNELYIKQPDFEDNYTVKWDGEWQITLEVFRDLGMAFLGVIVIIYMLIVGWFQNFKAPLVMMVAIPLSLIGIILGHWMLDAFFTATSFIGMIALAGIMVRNSVLLIDFVNLRVAEGVPLKSAVIEAGAVRTTPILLTAGTVVIGAFVILFDPIFQGLAISLMGGTIVSTFLTLLVVPLVYYLIERKNHL
jgi:multidrug efflux pump subunit AcrB